MRSAFSKIPTNLSTRFSPFTCTIWSPSKITSGGNTTAVNLLKSSVSPPTLPWLCRPRVPSPSNHNFHSSSARPRGRISIQVSCNLGRSQSSNRPLSTCETASYQPSINQLYRPLLRYGCHTAGTSPGLCTDRGLAKTKRLPTSMSQSESSLHRRIN